MVGMKSGAAGGEIIEVDGGHIIRSTGRKDRHSKVYTAKGPRDRRVRLSAHTAIQFYDVQDRLGYDRPSKAVDWLIKKAQNAIDKLEELPPWHPVTTAAASSANPPEELTFDAESYNSFQLHRQLVETETESNNNDSSSMMPNYCIDNSEAIAFFPKCASDQTSAMNFHSYQHGAVSRALNPREDLCLSLQTVPNESGSALFPSPVGFDAGAGASAGWSVGRYQRMGAWNGSSERFEFHAPPPPLVGQGSEFTQERGALQSGLFSSPTMRSWNDLSATSGGGAGAFGSSEFLGFRIPGRIRDDDAHGIGSDLKLPSSSN